MRESGFRSVRFNIIYVLLYCRFSCAYRVRFFVPCRRAFANVGEPRMGKKKKETLRIHRETVVRQLWRLQQQKPKFGRRSDAFSRGQDRKSPPELPRNLSRKRCPGLVKAYEFPVRTRWTEKGENINNHTIIAVNVRVYLENHLRIISGGTNTENEKKKKTIRQRSRRSKTDTAWIHRATALYNSDIIVITSCAFTVQIYDRE